MGHNLPTFDFLTTGFLRDGAVNPKPNPQPGGLGLHIRDPRSQVDLTIPPRHWVLISVPFYETHHMKLTFR
jgi:hypothetical protein